MNSTSSTEPAFAAVSGNAPASARPPAGESRVGAWQFFLTASLIGAAVSIWLAPPAPRVALLFMSLGVFAAGAAAAALHGVLTSLGAKQTADAPATGSLREALEREKLLTLRAIKDLEFDRAMGKVSEADAAPMDRRLRERAMAIMQQLDGREGLRARIEEDIARRKATGRQATSLEPVQCAACGIANDADARFCKSCGGRLAS